MNRIWKKLKELRGCVPIIKNTKEPVKSSQQDYVEIDEYIKNYLESLVELNINFDKKTRLKNYVDFFADNFFYDYNYRKEILQNHSTRIKTPKQALFDTLSQRKGLCTGFSNALSLLSYLDGQKTGDFFQIKVASLAICLKKDLTTYGHAINVFEDENKHDAIIDISCMIHCKEKELEGNKDDFFCKSLSQYKKALGNAGVEMRNTPKYKINFIYWEDNFYDRLARIDDVEPIFEKTIPVRDFSDN